VHRPPPVADIAVCRRAAADTVSAPGPYDAYTSPLAQRNASAEMLRLWSPRHRFNTWRRIWLAVAESQHALGLPVTKEQVEALRAVVQRPGGITDDEIRAAERYERDLRHDVMAHVHALGDACPAARPIIHLGMTSEDVGSNADIAILREALVLIHHKCVRAVVTLGERAAQHARTPALGFTHLQAAQPVTVGRRLAGAAWDLFLAAGQLRVFTPFLRFKGLRGATGTQASYLALFDGRGDRVDALEADFIDRLAAGSPWWDPDTFLGDGDPFPGVHGPVGQTYPRVVDGMILGYLASTASVLHKIATDFRLLCNHKELDEPFEQRQVGSSAMPYKRNPMRCERICGLSRFVMNLVGNAYDTAATQWLERTLDDSSNRRLSLPEAFLALDGALDLVHNVASGLIVHEAMVRRNLMAELPFLAAENILMACVKAGGDRQDYHERIRVHAQAAGARVKDDGLDNDLLDRLQRDPAFHPPAIRHEIDWSGLMDPMRYVGRSVEQTERFVREVVEPLREQYGEEIAGLGSSGPRV
jgi:adenylosuccinate lyase